MSTRRLWKKHSGELLRGLNAWLASKSKCLIVKASLIVAGSKNRSPPLWISNLKTQTPLMLYWLPPLGQKVVAWRDSTNCAVGPRV